MEKKIEKKFIYEGFGFPVELKNVTLYKINDEWTPKFNLKKVAKNVISILSKKKEFTGFEIFFIRSHLRLSKVDFGEKVGVSHAAVSNWEKKREKVVPMEKGNFADVVKLIVVTKAPKKKTASKPNAAFMKPLNPTKSLEEIMGSVPRTEQVKKLWAYIKKHNLQNPLQKRLKQEPPAKKSSRHKAPSFKALRKTR